MRLHASTLPHNAISSHALLTLIRSFVVSSVDYCNSVVAGVSGHLLDRLQSVLSTAARLIFSARKSEHITSLLSELHWLQVPEKIQFRLCVLAYRCLHDTMLTYLAEMLHRTTYVDGRCRLCSAATPTLLVPSTRRSSLGDRAFPVVASRAWNSLPADVRDAPPLLTFQRHLKTLLFQSSYGWAWWRCSPSSAPLQLSHVNCVKCPCNTFVWSVTLISTFKK